MYKMLSELESDELCERVTDGSLTEEGYEITCEILNERGVKIPPLGTYEIKRETLMFSIKRFCKDRPILSIIIFCFATNVVIKILQRL